MISCEWYYCKAWQLSHKVSDYVKVHGAWAYLMVCWLSQLQSCKTPLVLTSAQNLCTGSFVLWVFMADQLLEVQSVGDRIPSSLLNYSDIKLSISSGGRCVNLFSCVKISTEIIVILSDTNRNITHYKNMMLYWVWLKTSVVREVFSEVTEEEIWGWDFYRILYSRIHFSPPQESLPVGWLGKMQVCGTFALALLFRPGCSIYPSSFQLLRLC